MVQVRTQFIPYCVCFDGVNVLPRRREVKWSDSSIQDPAMRELVSPTSPASPEHSAEDEQSEGGMSKHPSRVYLRMSSGSKVRELNHSCV